MFIPPQNDLPSPRSVLKMRLPEDDERTAGSMPVWERRPAGSEPTARGAAESAIGRAALEGSAAAPSRPDSALAYAPDPAPPEAEEPFGFGDLLDMVNPLQHIPVVGTVYRAVTGDTIRPVAQIIGGGLFGGVAGAAGSFVNVLVEQETGKDIAGNVVSFVMDGEKPAFRSAAAASDSPEKRLDTALQTAQNGRAADDPAALPGTVMAYADLGGGSRGIVREVAAPAPRTDWSRLND